MNRSKRNRFLCSLFLLIFLVGCNNHNTARFIEHKFEDRAVILDVALIQQYPHYPTGCESVTAVMALQHSGFSITVDEFIDHHLPTSSSFYQKDDVLYGPDPNSVFVGDPRSENSYGCMSPVIYTALQSYVNGRKEIIDTSGTDLNPLCETYIDNGTPVILWATMDMKKATAGNSWFLEDGRFYVWTAGEHCLLLIGYNDREYIFNDPRYGAPVAYPKEAVEINYAALGKQSLVIQ